MPLLRLAIYVPPPQNSSDFPAWEQALLSLVGVAIAFAILWGLAKLVIRFGPKAQKSSDDGQLDLTTQVSWGRTTDSNYPFRAVVGDSDWQLGANQHGGPPYELLVDGRHRATLDAWPEAWTFPAG